MSKLPNAFSNADSWASITVFFDCASLSFDFDEFGWVFSVICWSVHWASFWASFRLVTVALEFAM